MKHQTSKSESPAELDLERILDRVAEAAGVRRDSDVARALQMTPTALANAKARGSMPYGRLIAFAERNGVALEYLFWGSGPPKRRSGEVDPALFARAGAALDVHLAKRAPVPPPTRDLCAGMICNDVCNLPEPQQAAALTRAAHRVVHMLEALGGAKKLTDPEGPTVHGAPVVDMLETLQAWAGKEAADAEGATIQGPKKRRGGGRGK